MSASPFLARLVALLITCWAGSLWTICGLVAPTLFAVLDDRHMAGQLVGRFFHIQTWIGVTIGSVLIGLGVAGRALLPGRALIWIAAGLPLASHVLLGPLMDQARVSGDLTRFGLLHAAAGACFLAACIALVMLVWKINRPAG
ncbi:MAG TPA: DUF4149 domain-containing protein [Povalibacter sp.]